MALKKTKTELARVVIMGLYNLDSLPAPNNRNVQRKVRALDRNELAYQHNLAVRALRSVGKGNDLEYEPHA